MKIVNPAWRKAVRVKLADRDMTKNELVEQAKLKSREYTSAVVNGRVQSEKYAASISDCLGITVPYLVEIAETDIV